MDVEQRIHLNTAVSALMELVNELYAFGDAIQATPTRPQSLAVAARSDRGADRDDLAVRAAHGRGAVGDDGPCRTASRRTSWPSFDESVARAEEIVVPVQVNGKLRSRLTVPADTPESELRERALADPAVRQHTDGKTIKTVVVAKGKLINVVVV